MVDQTYESLLESGSWDEVPEDKTLPEGNYLLKGRNAVIIEPKEEGQSQRVLFFYNVQEAMDDVDRDELASLGDDYDITENEVVAQFFVSKRKDLDRIRKHLIAHGIEIPLPEDVARGAPKKSIPESLMEFKNTEVVAYLKQNTFTDSAGEVRQDNRPVNFTPVG